MQDCCLRDRAARQLKEENAWLKRIVADLSLHKAMLQDIMRASTVAWEKRQKDAAALRGAGRVALLQGLTARTTVGSLGCWRPLTPSPSRR